jgi:hypothetical protein
MGLLILLHISRRAQNRRTETTVRLGCTVKVFLEDLLLQDPVQRLYETEAADEEREELTGFGEVVVFAAEDAFEVVEV